LIIANINNSKEGRYIYISYRRLWHGSYKTVWQSKRKTERRNYCCTWKI